MQSVLRLGLAAAIVTLFLVGCGPKAGPRIEPTAATEDPSASADQAAMEAAAVDGAPTP